MKMIDANELLKELEKVCNSLQMKGDTQRANLIMSGIYVAKRHIQEMLTVDIIRCKDCKHYHKMHDGMYYCMCHDDDILWLENDYCSRAEPKQR